MDNKIILFSISSEELASALQAAVAIELEKQKALEFEQKLLSPSEACKLFQPPISLVTLAKWTREGYLKSYRIGSRVFYKPAEILDSLQTLKKYKRNI